MLQYLRRKVGTRWAGIRFNRFLGWLELGIMHFCFKDAKKINSIKEIKREDKQFLFKPSELFLLYSISSSQRSLKGDYAEVGVYNGSSAKIICESKGGKKLHLFDTFEGIPEVGKIDEQFSKSQFRASLESVKKRLSRYENVLFYKGIFPQSGTRIKNVSFSFVHLDVDIYKSTKDSLIFFYKRMVPGGIIISHDYPQHRGVKKAFEEFFKDKKEEIIELPMSQGMIIKH